jgi:hypothetical protein
MQTNFSSFRDDIRKGGGKHTNSSKFPPNMQDHNDRHDQGDNVHEGRRALEDNRVGQLDIPRIAIGLRAPTDADGSAQRYSRALTYPVKGTETHDWRFFQTGDGCRSVRARSLPRESREVVMWSRRSGDGWGLGVDSIGVANLRAKSPLKRLRCEV